MSASPDSPRVVGRRRLLQAGSVAALVSGLASLIGPHAARAAGLPDDAGADSKPAGRMPSLFIGHGSPMNALQQNDYTRALRAWGQALRARHGRPRAILVVSAHWLTQRELQVSVAERPETIHDFGGFPAALQRMQYPAPGAPALARQTAGCFAPQRVGLQDRGLDHGAWTVLHHLVPAADVPVFQLSIDIVKPGAYQLGVGRALAALRDEGVLLLGSGNVVHNLRATLRDAPDSPHGLTPWAEDFDLRVKQALDANDQRALADYARLTEGAETAVPFPDHYHPLLVAMGAAQAGEKPRHVFEGFQAGTLSMRCVQWG